MATYDFAWLDVFTDRPLGGNPLPVVFDPAQALSEAQMLAVARELNTSETTFVVPPRDVRASMRLRCFSTKREVFGAGHNALGAWWAIVDRGVVRATEGETELVQELGDHVLPVTVVRERGELTRITMRQSPPEAIPGTPDRRALAEALGIDPSALDVPGLEPQAMSTGARHLLVPARTLADLARLRVDADRLVETARPFGCHGCYVFCLETAGPGAIAHARAFGPGIGIVEDPATGSAAGPLIAYLVARGRAPAGEWLIVEQGYEMGRPSRIAVRVTGDRVEIAGRCVTVFEGRLTV